MLTGIGSVMGFMGGLLGIGGGTIAVPGLRFAARLPLRNSIAIAAAVTVPMAVIGAIYKNLSLSELSGPDGASLSATQSIGIALAIVPNRDSRKLDRGQTGPSTSAHDDPSLFHHLAPRRRIPHAGSACDVS